MSNSYFAFQPLEQRFLLAAQLEAFVHLPTQAVAGLATHPAIVVDLEDGSGHVLTTDNSSVTLTKASGPGELGGTATVNAKKGVATFTNVLFNKTGAYTLTAGDATDGLSVTSGDIAVSAGAVASLTIGSLPVTVTAGEAISPGITVTAKDKFGNLVAGTPSVTLSVSTGPHGGALHGTTKVKASNGVATFNAISVNVSGAYTLKAAIGAVSGAAGGLTINPAAPAKLAYTQHPTNVTASDSITPSYIVKALDSFGNLCTNSNAQVTLAVNKGPNGAAVGGVSNVALSGGLATFNSLGLTVAGSYTLIASAAGAASAVSPTCTVTSGAAVSLNVVQQPTQGTHNSKLTTPLVVQVLDQFNNLVRTKSKVTLTLSNGSNDTLKGMLTATTNNGTAIFNDLLLAETGSFTIDIGDGGLTTSTADPINIG